MLRLGCGAVFAHRRPLCQLDPPRRFSETIVSVQTKAFQILFCYVRKTQRYCMYDGII